MKAWYEQKKEFNENERNLAKANGNDKAAARHEVEMKTYKEMADRSKT